jgi:pSer/pThr/pTyr-binding forkhead associated (FHA) protein
MTIDTPASTKARRRLSWQTRLSSWRPLGRLFPALLVFLASSATAFTQGDEYWDQPFSQPQYLVHITETGTPSGPRERDDYILYPQAPEDGVLLTADGYGGWFINSAVLAGGPFITPRQVCAGSGSIPPEKRPLDCSALGGAGDCFSQCRDRFPHGTWDQHSEYPDCSCICELHWEMNQDGTCVPCETVCKGNHLVYNRDNQEPNSCPCSCEEGYEFSGASQRCEKVECPDNATSIADLQSPSSPVIVVCPNDRLLTRHCCCEPGYLRYGSVCEKEKAGDEEYFIRPDSDMKIAMGDKVEFSVVKKDLGRYTTVSNDEIVWKAGAAKSINPNIKHADAEIGKIGKDGVFTSLGIGTVHIVAYIDGQVEASARITVKCPASAPGELGDILALYKSRIPHGKMWQDYYSGKSKDQPPSSPRAGYKNNINSWVWREYEPWVCEAYQKRVLDLLHRMRADPVECRHLLGWDFATIDGWFGAHLAVVIYPEGSSWQEKGVVLDPWPSQKPEAYYIDQWRFWGRIADRNYEDRLLDPAHAPAVKPRRPKIAGTVKCPVNLLIQDSQGRRLGATAGGDVRFEIPGAVILNLPDDEGENNWYFELYAGGEPYNLEITGLDAGTFELTWVDSDSRDIREYGAQQIAQGAAAAVLLDSGDASPPLVLPDGTHVEPTILKAPHDLRGLAAAALGVGFLALLFAAAGLLALRVTRRRRLAPATAVAAPRAKPARGQPLALLAHAPPGTPWGALTITSGPGSGGVLELDAPISTLGRSAPSDVILRDEIVSRQHAQLRWAGGSAFIQDLGSTNGTFVNGERVTALRPLVAGDVIRLGNTEAVYVPWSSGRRPPASGAWLAVTRGKSLPSTTDLTERKAVSIGRSRQNHVVIPSDAHVSRRHAQIRQTGRGHEVVDLDSATGVFVNGSRVRQCLLRSGDRIRLGSTEFTYNGE